MRTAIVFMFIVGLIAQASADQLILRSNPRDLEPYREGNYSKSGCQTVLAMRQAEFAEEQGPDGDPFLKRYHKGNVWSCE